MVVAISGWFSGSSDVQDLVIFAVTLSAMHWSIAGLFMVTEPDHMSRRIRQRLPNLNEAGQMYGPIIYHKAPIIMRRLTSGPKPSPRERL